eukprot:2319473-Rhodomonas_salina.2
MIPHMFWRIAAHCEDFALAVRNSEGSAQARQKLCSNLAVVHQTGQLNVKGNCRKALGRLQRKVLEMLLDWTLRQKKGQAA